MANILLVDASPLIYSNFNAMKRFKTKAGEPTGLRFGFMRSMRSYVEKTKADRVAICLDLLGVVKKAVGVPEYKANRVWSKDKEEMYDQIPNLLEMLSYTRYAQVQAEGYEADDVIAHLARKFEVGNHDVFIVSPDNDLLQLVSKRVRIWMPPKKENKNKAWFKDEDYCMSYFGVKPEYLLYFRALTGDSSDNLKGCVKSKYVENLAHIFCEKLKKNYTTRQIREEMMHMPGHYFIDGWLKVFKRNMHVMRLHDPVPGVLRIKKGKKDPTALRELLLKLEMKSLIPYVGKYTGIQEPGLDIKDA